MPLSQFEQIKPYRHVALNADKQEQHIDLPVGKVVCVGRNYMDHIEEMSNQVSEVPLLFMKPSTAMVDMQKPVAIPTQQGECHNELEVALLIGKKITKGDVAEASEAVCGIGLGLDLTLRDVQQRLKQAGQPWERAKSFDASCPLSPFAMIDSLSEDDRFAFELQVNHQLIQSGDTNLMLTPMLDLIVEISQYFTLFPGDVILTGTPKGVGPLNVNDEVTATLAGHLSVTTRVISQ
jgi:2-keto-4-pentenoate hydratase/2-oxohepta-3-ene-1,7-dioic acid hydratase in catechol pathway